MDFPNLPGNAPESAIAFHFDDVQFELPDTALLDAWLRSAAESEGKQMGELNYIFCSDERLRAINVEYLDHDYYTDVITFPYGEDGIYGDVFISADRVRDNAQALQVGFGQELLRVMVHGLLHLAGYDDKTPELKARMSAREDFHLQRTALFTTAV